MVDWLENDVSNISDPPYRSPKGLAIVVEEPNRLPPEAEFLVRAFRAADLPFDIVRGSYGFSPQVENGPPVKVVVVSARSE